MNWPSRGVACRMWLDHRTRLRDLIVGPFWLAGLRPVDHSAIDGNAHHRHHQVSHQWDEHAGEDQCVERGRKRFQLVAQENQQRKHDQVRDSPRRQRRGQPDLDPLGPDGALRSSLTWCLPAPSIHLSTDLSR